MIYILKNKTIIISLLLTVLFTGCGYKQTNTQIRDVAFLKFTKSLSENYIVVVNDKYKFNIDACIKNANTNECYDTTADKLYEITSGNSVIQVFDNKNNLIIKKEMYIGSSNTKEINLP
jgi:hypothetical protein